MSRYTHAPSKQPPPPITTLSRATESLFEYVDNTITRSFQILEDLLKTHKYRSQKSDILGSRRAYENWVSESNITDTSKRTENRMIALAAPHVLERLVALLTDLDSTLYSAAYHIRKRQVDGRMVDWFVRDVQIALGRVEDFMEEWRGDENGFGADDMRTPMPGDFFDAEELSRGVVQDVEGREIAERIEAEERERAERAKLGDRGGRGGYARGYTYPDQEGHYQHEQQYAGRCQRGRHRPGCQHEHQHSHQHVHQHRHPNAHAHVHHHADPHRHAYGPHGGRHCH